MFDKGFNQLGKFASLPLRIVLGIVFFAHGAQKILGWYGGGGFAATEKGFENLIPYVPGTVAAVLGGGGELLGGILVFLGLFTRFGAFLIAAAMAVAILAVHLPFGLFASENGFEYPLMALAAALSLMLSGAPVLSLDSLLSIRLKK